MCKAFAHSKKKASEFYKSKDMQQNIMFSNSKKKKNIMFSFNCYHVVLFISYTPWLLSRMLL